MSTDADSATGRNLLCGGVVRWGSGTTRDVTMIEGWVDTAGTLVVLNALALVVERQVRDEVPWWGSVLVGQGVVLWPWTVV